MKGVALTLPCFITSSLWSSFPYLKSNEVSSYIDGIRIFYNQRQLFQLYYAYSIVDEFCNDSFTSMQLEALYHLAIFLINCLDLENVPDGISVVNILCTLAKQARRLGAFQVARFAYKRLQILNVPKRLAGDMNLDPLTIQVSTVQEGYQLDVLWQIMVC